jgi:hypothetical protein
MKKTKRINPAKRVKIILQQDETLVIVHTSDGTVSFIRESYHNVKDLADNINFCMDSGFYDKEIVAECERLNAGFSITADQTGLL